MDGAAAERGRGRANSTAVARMKPPPSPMMAISERKAAEDEQHGLRIGAFARRQIAAQRVDQIADREQARPMAMTNGMASGPMPYIVVVAS